MKVLIILLFLPFTSKSQTPDSVRIKYLETAQKSDSVRIKYLEVQNTIVKTMTGLNKADFVAFKKAQTDTLNDLWDRWLNTDYNLFRLQNQHALDIKKLQDSINFYKGDTIYLGNGLKFTIDSSFHPPRKILSLQ